MRWRSLPLLVCISTLVLGLVATAPLAQGEVVIQFQQYPSSCSGNEVGRAIANPRCRRNLSPALDVKSIPTERLRSEYDALQSRLASDLNRVEKVEVIDRMLDLIAQSLARGTASEQFASADLEHLLGLQSDLLESPSDQREFQASGARLVRRLQPEARKKADIYWASAVSSLGALYARQKTEFADNNEFALAAFEAVVESHTIWQSSDDWQNAFTLSNAQHGLATAYLLRRYGDREENLRRAIGLLNEVVKSDQRIDQNHVNNIAEAKMRYELGWAYYEFWRSQSDENVQNRASADAMLDVAIQNLEAAYAVQHAYVPPWSSLAEVLNPGAGADQIVDPGGSWRTSLVLGQAYAARGGAWTAKGRALLERAAMETTTYIADEAPLGRGRLLCALGKVISASSPQELIAAEAAFRDGSLAFTGAKNPEERLRCLTGLAETELLIGNWQAASEAASEALAILKLVKAKGDLSPDVRAALIETSGLPSVAAYADWRLGNLPRAWQRLEDGRAQLFALRLDASPLGLSQEAGYEVRRLRGRLTNLRGQLEVENVDRVAVLTEMSSLSQQIRKLSQAPAGVRPAANDLQTALTSFDIVIAPVVTARGGVFLLAEQKEGQVKLRAIAADTMTSAALVQLSGGTGNGDGASWFGAYMAAADKQASAAAKLAWFSMITDTDRYLAAAIGSDFRRALTGVPGQRMLLVQSSELSMFPLGLLTVNGGLLADAFQISYAPSVRAIVPALSQQVSSATTRAAVVMANPAGSGGIGALEGFIVARSFSKSTPLFDENATAAKLFDAVPRSNVLHVASHAIFNFANPDASGIALAGGQLLEARSIAGSGLDAHLDLVFLSACETGFAYSRQAPDEFVGLPAAFLEMGTRTVISTLWQVSDVGATVFALHFYHKYQVEGLAPAQALQATQKWMRLATSADIRNFVDATMKRSAVPEAQADAFIADITRLPGDHPLSEPYYWAGYALYGS